MTPETPVVIMGETFFGRSKNQQLRPHRFDAANGDLDLRLIVNGRAAILVNLSDAGLSFVCPKEALGHSGSHIEVELDSGHGQRIYSGYAKIVWVKPENADGVRCGAILTSEVLGQHFVESLSTASHARQSQRANRAAWDLLSAETKLLLGEMRNYFSHLLGELTDIEQKMELQSRDSQNSLLRALEVFIEPEIIAQLEKLADGLTKIDVRITSNEERDTLRGFVQRLLGDYLNQGSFPYRASRKPRNTAIDYETVNQMQRNAPEGTTLFAKLMHKAMLALTESRLTAQRSRLVSGNLKRVLHENGSLTLANVGCGPAWEIVDFLKRTSTDKLSSVRVALVDPDIEAILYAKLTLSSLIYGSEHRPEVRFVPASVRDFLDRLPTLATLNDLTFDVIYVSGLLDWVSQPVARLFCSELASRLKPGGSLIVRCFHPDNPLRILSEYAWDWKMLPRSKMQMMEILQVEEMAKVQVLSEHREGDLFVEGVRR